MPKDQWKKANNRARYGPTRRTADDAKLYMERQARKREARQAKAAERPKPKPPRMVVVLACRPVHVRKPGEAWRSYITTKETRLQFVTKAGNRIYLTGDGWEMKVLEHFTRTPMV